MQMYQQRGSYLTSYMRAMIIAGMPAQVWQPPTARFDTIEAASETRPALLGKMDQSSCRCIVSACARPCFASARLRLHFFPSSARLSEGGISKSSEVQAQSDAQS